MTTFSFGVEYPLRSSNICTVLHYKRPFDGSNNVEVALSENEFDTLVLKVSKH